MPGIKFNEIEIDAGRTIDLAWEIFDADQVRPLVIAAGDKVRFKLSASEGGAPATDLDLLSGEAGDSRVTIDSLGQSLTPQSTDDALDQLTFAAAHNWATGTPVYALGSGSGLTAGVRYYVRAVSATVVSLHSSAADAEADTGRTDLTADVSSPLVEPARGAVRLAQGHTAGLAISKPVTYFGELILIDDSETSPADAAKPIVRGRFKVRPSQSGPLTLTP